MTFLAIFTIAYLLTGEIVGHFRAKSVTDLFIDEDVDQTMMVIDFDIEFEEIPCFYIDVELSDVTGGMSHNITKNIKRIRRDHKGRELGEQDEGGASSSFIFVPFLKIVLMLLQFEVVVTAV